MLLLKPYGTAQYGRTPSSYVTFINTVATYVLPRKNIRRALDFLHLCGRNVGRVHVPYAGREWRRTRS